MTRPEPTIYGNCDSWEFIVGRKPVEVVPQIACPTPLHDNDINFIHSLLTIWLEKNQNNLLVICGSICTTGFTSHMVKKWILHISKFTVTYAFLDGN